jgi:hypothetical protein
MPPKLVNVDTSMFGNQRIDVVLHLPSPVAGVSRSAQKNGATGRAPRGASRSILPSGATWSAAQAYLAADQRLCARYLLHDQRSLGAALSALSVS